MRLENQVAVVTGGSRGIGAGIVRTLVKEGAYVVLVYQGSEERANQLKEELGDKVRIFKCNVAHTTDCEALFAFVMKEYARVDILVNNAGITRDILLMRMSEKDYDDVLDTNLKGAFNCSKLAIRQMIKQKSGRVIHISSISGIYGNAGQVNYAASKAGLIGMTKAMAKELGSRGITVNAIAPGFIQTDMTDGMPEKIKEKLLDKIALGCLGEVEDIAQAVVYLASKSGRYVTGHVLQVDGGMVI